jgi:hypothetical protein
MIFHEAEPDYYAVLQVAPDATAAEIERSYRRLAARYHNARWRAGRAARELALVNAAYGVLGYPERRADYDRRRSAAADRAASELEEGPRALPSPEPALVTYRNQGRGSLPRVTLGRSHGASPLDAIIIILVVGLALLVASSFASRPLVDLSFVQRLGETAGLVPRQRTPPSPTPPQTPSGAAAVPSPEAGPSPTPQPPPGALPTTVAGQRFAGSEVSISEPRPTRQSDVTVTLKLMREGQPLPNANVYLVAHYRTLDERQPPGTSTVRTDDKGMASIAFNIGDATPGFQVNVDLTALADGQQVPFQTSFTPR